MYFGIYTDYIFKIRLLESKRLKGDRSDVEHSEAFKNQEVKQTCKSGQPQHNRGGGGPGSTCPAGRHLANHCASK